MLISPYLSSIFLEAPAEPSVNQSILSSWLPLTSFDGNLCTAWKEAILKVLNSQNAPLGRGCSCVLLFQHKFDENHFEKLLNVEVRLLSYISGRKDVHRLVRLLSCHIIGINILFLPAASSQGTFHKMTQHKKQYTTLYCILKQLGDVHRQCLIFYLTNVEVHSCQSWGTRCKKTSFLGGVCIFYFSLMAWMNQLFHLRSELYSLRLDGELPLEFFLAAGSKSFNWEDWVVARSSLSETKVADKI